VRGQLGLAPALLIWSAASCAGSGGDRAALPAPAADTVAVGAGRYTTTLPADEKPPSNQQGVRVRPKVTESFAKNGALPTSNDWWSSLIWQFDRAGKANPYSEPLFAHPLSLKALPDGLGLGGAGPPQIASRTYFFPYLQDLKVGVEGLRAAATQVSGYGDWSVTAHWRSDPKPGAPAASLTATFGHGLPFAYFEASGPALVELSEETVAVFAETPGSLGLTVGGRAYGLFAPTGATWTRAPGNRRIRSDLNGRAARGVFAVALLPDASAATLARFRRHAFAFVTDTRVSWRYDAASADLHTTFTAETTSRDPAAPAAAGPLLALYPHQWKNLGRDLGSPAFQSPRGPMKLLAGSSFSIRMPFGGVLPVLPRPPEGAFQKGTLAGQVRAAARADDLFPPGLEGTRGTYWIGKSLQRVALLAWLAEQVGETEVRTRLVGELARVLEDWFDGAAPNRFYYDQTWATLIGLPSEYRSGWEMNDHHFHYGQMIFAAATVARFDPAWARNEKWGAFVDLLIKDCANPDRADRRFPFLRNFDAYAGHSWANGPSLFPEGNNEESSSEDANFANAVTLWGIYAGKTEMRDLGIFLQTNLVAAIEQYWFNLDGDNFPPGFSRPALGMVWGSGGKYDTWWDRNPIYVHGINFLPFTGGSLYLGRRPDYVRRNYQAVFDANRGEPRLWREIIWMYLALGDPARALAQYRQNPHFEAEFGVSRAFVYQWLHALASFGQVDATVTADSPTYAVLRDGATRHHVALNPGGSALKVRFSDGVVVELGPFEQKVVSTPVAPATAVR
jgi:endoglucanase Acf2